MRKFASRPAHPNRFGVWPALILVAFFLYSPNAAAVKARAVPGPADVVNAVAVPIAASGPSGLSSDIGGSPTHYWTPVGPGWKLTFDDEFDGTAANTRRWGIPDETVDHTYATYSNAVFKAANISVANGFAELTVTQTAAGYGTAAMTSYFSQTYGYWEARVRPPCYADGIAAGFWTDARGWTFPEIDILEWIGITPTTNYMTWHYAYPQDGNNAVGISSSLSDVNFCGSFHVVGMWWRPTSITWYIDGAQVAQTKVYVNAQNAAPLWVILDATVGGFGIDYIDQTTQFPAHYLVDYVHVYSSSANAVAVAPDAGYRGPGDALGSGNGATADRDRPATPGPQTAARRVAPMATQPQAVVRR